MINRMIIYLNRKKLTDHRPRHQPSEQSEKESGSQKQSWKQESEHTLLLLFEANETMPNGLLSYSLLAKGAEAAPTAHIEAREPQLGI